MDESSKSWDHSWSSEEMRKKRKDWSLAGDAGLLKHMEFFHKNLSTRAQKTQEDLDTLANQLNETAILVDNVTNISLALANTQFIESRVHEDDVEIVQPSENKTIKEMKDQELSTTELIASVSENILQGLKIMDEKYDKVQVIASDSEDEGESAVPSVILKAKDPYQDRPLPYIIGSEKWIFSKKIGLEYSSSDSDQMEDGNEKDDECWSENDDKKCEIIMNNSNAGEKGVLNRVVSSESSESDNYRRASEINNGHTVNADSEATTPSSVLPKVENNGPPSFAEELAKRLGKVVSTPAQKPAVIKETSVNRFQDENLFTANDEDVFSVKSDKFSGGKGLFDDDDNDNNDDNEEDDDDEKFIIKTTLKNESPLPDRGEIYAAKIKANFMVPSIDVPPPISSISVKPKSAIDDLFGNADSEDSDDDIFSSKMSKKVVTKTSSNIRNILENIGTAVIPKTSDVTESLFQDEDDDLFSVDYEKDTYEKESVAVTKKKPVGGISIFGNVDPSPLNLGVKMSRQRQSSYHSLDSEETQKTDENNVSNEIDGNKNSSYKALKSRSGDRVEQVSSDYFTNVTKKQNIEPSFEQDNNSIFSNDDIFGPPPLPESSKKKRKSKVVSIFDDSDSGDDLFSNTSSGSRSQKSNDLLIAERAEAATKKSLFEDDIFGSNDTPDVDLFGENLKSSLNDHIDSQKHTDSIAGNIFTSNVKTSKEVKINSPISKEKPLSIFDDDSDQDLFGTSIKSKRTPPSIFDDEEDFSVGSSTVPKIEQLRASRIMEPSGAEKKRMLEGAKNIFADVVTVEPNRQPLFDDDDDGEERDLFATTPREKTKEPLRIMEEENISENLPAKVAKSVSVEKDKEKNQSDLNVVDGGLLSKKTYPKSLNIRISSTTENQMNDDKQKRGTSGAVVSNKIKNLMGKMGNFKILSPTDTPPLWRKNEEKTNQGENENFDDDDSDSSLSIRTSPQNSEDSQYKQVSVGSMENTNSEENAETAVSFDEPVRVESLSSTASKNRARIPTKRRPQSRHARQSALRHSGIDFDVVDTPKWSDFDKESSAPSIATDLKISDEVIKSEVIDNERLSVPAAKHEKSDNQLVVDTDKSERSLSKESSLSVNKNTLLSPSTDEEDLFDVLLPPDLPEDSFKEDPLFGRAPLLSPIEYSSDSSSISNKERNYETRTSSSNPETVVQSEDSKIADDVRLEEKLQKQKPAEKSKDKDSESCEKKDLTDPLRDTSHDSLKDPSQLFAFVTKTPSPEKGKALLQQLMHDDDDDSLFSAAPTSSLHESTSSKNTLDLFGDDTAGDGSDGDLFSVKPLKKHTKDAKVSSSLFDDDQEDKDEDKKSSFFFLSKKEEKPNEDKVNGSKEFDVQNSLQKSIFEDGDDNEEPFFATKKGKQEAKASNLKDIFGDQSSGEDDLFGKASTKKSLFDNAEDDEDEVENNIFGKASAKSSEQTRTSGKKPVMRDLKKTAEMIIEDPLSVLRDE